MTKRSRFYIEFDGSRLMGKCLDQTQELVKYEKQTGRSPWTEGDDSIIARFINAGRRSLRTGYNSIGINLSEPEAAALHNYIWMMESCQDEIPSALQAKILDRNTQVDQLGRFWTCMLYDVRCEMEDKGWW